MISSVSGPQLAECAQLSIHYLELSILAICGYSGQYSRRGWRDGWKGQDETLVPWVESRETTNGAI
jgi:hypothetical protein